MGPSGSGKSTFMNLIGCLDRPTRRRLPPRRHGRSRRSTPTGSRRCATARSASSSSSSTCCRAPTPSSNVELPMIYAGRRAADAARAGAGGARRASASPTARIIGRRSCPAASSSASPSPAPSSTARACSSPTSRPARSTRRTAIEILALFQELNREGVTVVLVTHDADVARHARRVVRFKDGRVLRRPARRMPRGVARLVMAA